MGEDHGCQFDGAILLFEGRAEEYCGRREYRERCEYSRLDRFVVFPSFLLSSFHPPPFPSPRFPSRNPRHNERTNTQAGFANNGAYVASKHGVVGLTRSAAKENGARNIRVNAVAPGAIATPLLAKADAIQNVVERKEPSAFKRLGTPEEIGYLIAFLLGPESTFTTGMVYGADGGWAC